MASDECGILKKKIPYISGANYKGHVCHQKYTAEP